MYFQIAHQIASAFPCGRRLYPFFVLRNTVDCMRHVAKSSCHPVQSIDTTTTRLDDVPQVVHNGLVSRSTGWSKRPRMREGR
jgi:hypothetical protein